MNENKDFDNLETIFAEKSDKKADLKILDNAQDYNINLDELEKFSSEDNIEINEEKNKSQNYNKKVWRNYDVNLKDVMNFIMNDADRPIIMVYDDKIVYINLMAMQDLELKSANEAIGNNFLDFVDKKNWNSLTANIGEMLTSGTSMNIRLRSVKGRFTEIEVKAIYLQDPDHFSFILVGNIRDKATKPVLSNLYDEQTGLPNFFLFEDRIQAAVNNENYKNGRLAKSMIAVAAINFENMDSFKKIHAEERLLKKTATELVLNIRKNYTVARGLRYPLWILLPEITNMEEMGEELKKIETILEDVVKNDFSGIVPIINMGVSIFPNPAKSSKKLIEQAVERVRINQGYMGNKKLKISIYNV